MKIKLMLAVTALLFVTGVCSASGLSYWNQFGRADGWLTSDTEATLDLSYTLTKPLPNGSTTVFTGTVKAVASDSNLIPDHIDYTVKFDNGMGWITLVGYVSELSDADQCLYAMKTEAHATGGRISFDPASTTSYAVSPNTTVVLRGTMNICTYEESSNIVGGQLVLIIP
jgi:hypothetical protein